MQGHIFYGFFFGLVNEPAKPSKTVSHSIETISTGVAFLLLRLLPTSCGHNEWRYFRHTWCSIERRAGARARHGGA